MKSLEQFNERRMLTVAVSKLSVRIAKGIWAMFLKAKV